MIFPETGFVSRLMHSANRCERTIMSPWAIHNRPPFLFIKGELSAADARAVAVVGSNRTLNTLDFTPNRRSVGALVCQHSVNIVEENAGKRWPMTDSIDVRKLRTNGS